MGGLIKVKDGTEKAQSIGWPIIARAILTPSSICSPQAAGDWPTARIPQSTMAVAACRRTECSADGVALLAVGLHTLELKRRVPRIAVTLTPSKASIPYTTFFVPAKTGNAIKGHVNCPPSITGHGLPGLYPWVDRSSASRASCAPPTAVIQNPRYRQPPPTVQCGCCI